MGLPSPLGTFAKRIEASATWKDLALPAAEMAVLHQIAKEAAERAGAYTAWGSSKRKSQGPGISALFAGGSRTGRTMAAEALAGDLRLDLYRIDLRKVVSKFIGETEKNLGRLFDATQDGGAILFFDEADALFGKRTQVKNSHDRYANTATGYLLQRMEDYPGIVILATSSMSALDPAFLRRLRFVVRFPPRKRGRA